MLNISEHVMVDSSAIIAEDVEIGPWSIIGPNVTIGAGCKIGPHVVIKENTKMGVANIVHPFGSIGGDPQVRDYSGDSGHLEIGDHNVFHEYVTVSRGDISGQHVTRIGSRNLFMACAHVAHDCILHNDCILVNNAALAGHVVMENFSVLGAYCAVHQFCHLGAHSFLSRGAMVSQDVLPFMMVAGNPPSVVGINKVGLSRRGYSNEAIREITRAYKVIFRSQMKVQDAINTLQEDYADSAAIQQLITALERSERGILR